MSEAKKDADIISGMELGFKIREITKFEGCPCCKQKLKGFEHVAVSNYLVSLAKEVVSETSEFGEVVEEGKLKTIHYNAPVLLNLFGLKKGEDVCK